jgi:hypothetical protein
MAKHRREEPEISFLGSAGLLFAGLLAAAGVFGVANIVGGGDNIAKPPSKEDSPRPGEDDDVARMMSTGIAGGTLDSTQSPVIGSTTGTVSPPSSGAEPPEPTQPPIASIPSLPVPPVDVVVVAQVPPLVNAEANVDVSSRGLDAGVGVEIPLLGVVGEVTDPVAEAVTETIDPITGLIINK